MKKCPFCAEEILDAAIKCKHCQSMLGAPPSQMSIPPQTISGAVHRPPPTSAPSVPDLPSDPPIRSDLIYPSHPPKDPVGAAVLSGCCIAGLGQMVCGQVAKGITCLLGAIVLGALTGGLSALVTWPLLGIDAYMIANKLKKGQPVGKWEFF